MRSVDPSATSLEADFRGDGADLRAVYEQHGSLVYSLCRRSLGEERAKDVTQEVFVSAWRSRRRFDPEKGNLAAWLTAIAKRRIIDNIRSEARHLDRRATDDEVPTVGASGTENVESVADRLLLADALATLPDRTRQVIELVYVHDMTHAEAAEAASLPLGTVKSDVRRGLERIRALLQLTTHPEEVNLRD